MRFLIIVKAAAGPKGRVMAGEAVAGAMAAYRAELANAGVLLDVARLMPSSTGWRIRHDGATRTVVEGPFNETEELIAGYALIQVRSREEALEWTKRMPNPGLAARGEIEVRQLIET